MGNFQTKRTTTSTKWESGSKDQRSWLKMTNAIEKQTKGQSRSLLIKMWQEDCSRNEDISRKRWDNKNVVWLTKYAETFRLRHQDKNPFIKISDDKDKNKSYAEAAAKQTQVRRPQQHSRWSNSRQWFDPKKTAHINWKTAVETEWKSTRWTSSRATKATKNTRTE